MKSDQKKQHNGFGDQSQGPIFVLSPPRSGSTVLMRVLNCHPTLVIWGEHVGLINRLAEIDDMVRRVGRLMFPKTDEMIADYVAFPDHRLNEFDPWANPFDHASFRGSCREMIEGIFTRGLRPGQRWGFKETRYHRAATVNFLGELFPRAQFVMLSRDIREVATSAILAPWSAPRWFWDYQDQMPAEMAEAIVRDVTYALLVIERGLGEVRAGLGPRCLHFDYTAMIDQDGGFVAPLFRFLGLDVPTDVAARIDKVLSVRAGDSGRNVRFGGILSPEFIRARVTELARSLRAEIARDGIDKARLVARSDVGQYSFLAGDHTMRDQGCEFSSLFW
jgi:hypothetical protein